MWKLVDTGIRFKRSYPDLYSDVRVLQEIWTLEEKGRNLLGSRGLDRGWGCIR